MSKVCNKCGCEYKGVSAISRVDNKTLICPRCGTVEALESLGISKEEQLEILKKIPTKLEENIKD